MSESSRTTTANAQPAIPPPAVARWLIALAIGCALSVLLIIGEPNWSPGATIWAMICIGTGWVVAVTIAPWRRMSLIRSASKDIERLIRHLDAVSHRERSMNDLLLDRKDEIGHLSKAVHAALRHAIDERREARKLHRHLDHEVEKATHRATRALRQEVIRDGMTGLGNRRMLDDVLRQLSKRDKFLTAMAIDVDRFKQVNDTLGHAMGDQCLKGLAELMGRLLRKDDVAIRLGGDEFVIVVPGMSMSSAMAVARRLSTEFERLPWNHPIPRPTLSIGVAIALSQKLRTPHDIIDMADEALYASKRNGRGRVTSYDELKAA